MCFTDISSCAGVFTKAIGDLEATFLPTFSLRHVFLLLSFTLFFPSSISFKLIQCSVNNHCPSIQLIHLNLQSKHTMKRCLQIWGVGDEIHTVTSQLSPFYQHKFMAWRTIIVRPWYILILFRFWVCSHKKSCTKTFTHTKKNDVGHMVTTEPSPWKVSKLVTNVTNAPWS